MPQGENHSLAYLLRNLSVELDGRLSEALKSYGVSAAQWRVLSAVASGKARTPGGVSELQDIDSGSSSRMSQRLVDAGLLRRNPDPFDRRSVTLVPTAEAQSILPTATGIADQVYRRVVEGIEDYEVEHLRALLQRLLNNVRR